MKGRSLAPLASSRMGRPETRGAEAIARATNVDVKRGRDGTPLSSILASGLGAVTIVLTPPV